MKTDVVDIKPIAAHQREDARQVMISVCLELWPDLFKEAKDIYRLDPLDDIMDPDGYYFKSGGTFLVTVENGKVIGTGAVRSLGQDACELRRMWLMPQHHGRGLGKRMAEELLAYSRRAGYLKVRLETYDAIRQRVALQLYESLGFNYITRYNDGICTVFMEKHLD